MKITFAGHATVLVETPDISILCDPVFGHSFCEGLNAPYPGRTIIVDSLPKYDAVFISHRHLDHFDVATLSTLQKTIDVFLPDDPLMESTLRRMGYRSVYRLRDFESIKFGGTSILTTSSRNKVPELGLVIKSQGNTFWNQVDTVSSRESIAIVKDIVGEIDYLLAPWQPFIETDWQLTGRSEFPFKLYEAIIEEIFLVNPHFVSPGANGFKFVGKSIDLNHVSFPITPERFRADIHAFDEANTPTVLLFKPGDVFKLSNNVVRASDSSAIWIDSIEPKCGSELVFCPNILGSPFHQALYNPQGDFEKIQRFRPFLLALLANMTVESTALLRDWSVVYQLIILDDGQLHPLFVDFSLDNPLFENGWMPTRNYCVFITSGLLDRLLSSRISLSYVVTSGQYRVVNSIYQLREKALHRPNPVDLNFVDPLFSAFQHFADVLLESSISADLNMSSQGGGRF